MNRQQIRDDLAAFDAIPDHRTGTTGDLDTSRWLIDACRAAGVDAQLREFPFARRDVTDARVELHDGTRIEGVPLFDGPDTPAEGIVGPLGTIGSDALMGLVRFTPQGATGPSTTLDETRRKTGHAALIAIAAAENVAPGLAIQNAEHYGTPFGPPVLQVASDHRDRLGTAANSGGKVMLFIRSRWENTTATNVEAVIPGADPSLPPVVIYTPKSAWWTCTAERGGGLVTWLALMRHFAGNRPRATVHFTANSGHELGHLGMRRFLAANPALAPAAESWLHLGANFAAKDSRLLLQADTAQRLAPLVSALRKQGIADFDTLPHGNRPLGEARNIHDRGGRYLSMLGSNRWFHHPLDRLAASVDPDRCAAIVAAFLETIPEMINS